MEAAENDTPAKSTSLVTKTRRKVSVFLASSSNGRQRHLSAPSVNNGRESEPMQIQRTRSMALEMLCSTSFGCNPIRGLYRSWTSHLIFKVPWIIDNFSASRKIRSIGSNLKTFHKFQHWRKMEKNGARKLLERPVKQKRCALIGSPGRHFSNFFNEKFLHLIIF